MLFVVSVAVDVAVAVVVAVDVALVVVVVEDEGGRWRTQGRTLKEDSDGPLSKTRKMLDQASYACRAGLFLSLVHI